MFKRIKDHTGTYKRKKVFETDKLLIKDVDKSILMTGSTSSLEDTKDEDYYGVAYVGEGKRTNKVKSRYKHIPGIKSNNLLQVNVVTNQVLTQFTQKLTEDQLVVKIRSEALTAIHEDDVCELKSVFERYPLMQYRLDSMQLRDPKTHETLLHIALKENKKNVANHLIENSSIGYLFETFTNIEGQIPPSYMSCFHLLSILGDLNFMEKLIYKMKQRIKLYDITKQQFQIDKYTEEFNSWLNLKVVIKSKDERRRRCSALYLAVLNGHAHLLEFMKNLGLDLNEMNNESETLLMCSIENGSMPALKELLKIGVDPNLANKYKCTALHQALTFNQLEMATILIEQEPTVDINAERIKNPRRPILMAVNKNFLDIVKSLMKNGMKKVIPEHITHALFMACKLGYFDIVDFILGENINILNDTDDFLNSPIMIAAENNQLEIVKLLVDKNEVDITHKNKFRQTIFDLAMLQGNNDLLRLMMDKTGTSKDANSFYLHTAAWNGDIKKIEFMLLFGGVNMLSLDDNGNTFIHSAAFANRHKVLDFFLDIEDDMAEIKNNQHETVLHIAVKMGHAESVSVLISKRVKVDVINIENQNPFHIGVSSLTTNIEIIKQLLSVMKETYITLLNDQDKDGNTVLHLAAKFNRTDVLEILGELDPEVENTDGELPLHVAIHYGTVSEVETILKMFYSNNRRNVDYKDEEGYSPLFRSAEISDIDMFKLIIKYGGDIGSLGKEGCSILHRLIECKRQFPKKSEAYLQIYDIIVKSSVKWWVNFKGLKMPMKKSDTYYLYLMYSVRYLTNEIIYRSCNVLQYAAKMLEGELFQKILNTLYIYRFDLNSSFCLPKNINTEDDSANVLGKFLENVATDNQHILFDVTYLIPRNRPLLNLHSEKMDSIGSVEVAIITSTHFQLPSNVSCLEYVLESKNEDFINYILDDEPFKYLVSQYWTLCRRGYEILLWIHVIHMVLFTFFVMPTREWINDRFHYLHDNQTETLSPERYNSILLYWVFLIWPIVILVYQVLNGIRFIAHLTNIKTVKARLFAQNNKINDLTSGLMRVPIGTMLFFFDYISVISSILFICSSFAWFIMCLHTDSPHDYLDALAMVFIFGWLHTIKYVKGFKDWNSLVSILKQILIKDITCFTYIFIFVLISFGYALHVLIQADYNLKPRDFSSTYTIYSTFYRMLSPGDIFEYSEQQDYENAGGHVGILRSVCAAYSVLSTVVLMNLLIAMMNSTYSDIKSCKSTSWRIESLQKALWIEKHLYFFTNFSLLKFKTMYDGYQNRWFINHKTVVRNQDFIMSAADDIDSGKTESKNTNETDSGIKDKLDTVLKNIDSLIKQSNEIKQESELRKKNEERNTALIEELNNELKHIRKLYAESLPIATGPSHI